MTALTTTLTYTFGLLDPLDWGPDCDDQLWLMDKLWNSFVGIDREYREADRWLVDGDESVARLKSNLEQLEARQKELRRERLSLPVGLRENSPQSEELAVLATQVQVAAQLCKAARADARRRLSAERRLLERSRQNAVKQARKDSKLWWPNSNAIYERYDTARREAQLTGVALHFRRFKHTGTFNIQPHGFAGVDQVSRPPMLRSEELLTMIREGAERYRASEAFGKSGSIQTFIERLRPLAEDHLRKHLPGRLRGSTRRLVKNLLRTNDLPRAQRVLDEQTFLFQNLECYKPGAAIVYTDSIRGELQGVAISVRFPSGGDNPFKLSKYMMRVMFPGEKVWRRLSLATLFNQGKSLVAVAARALDLEMLPLREELVREVLQPYDDAPDRRGPRMADGFGGVWLDLKARPVPDRSGKRVPRLVFTIFNEREHHGGRKVTWPILYDRPLPDDAQILRVAVHIKKIGTHFQHNVDFTVRIPQIPIVHTHQSRTCAIALDFSRSPQGLRFATVLTDTGEETSEHLSASWLDSMSQLGNHRAARDLAFNNMAVELRTRWDQHPVNMPQELAAPLTAFIGSNRATAAELAEIVVRWRAYSHWWKGMFELLEEWRRSDKRQYERDSHKLQRLRLARREQYRQFAHRLTSAHALIGISYLDLNGLRRSRPFNSMNSADDRKHQFSAALSVLIAEIEHQARKHGSQIEYIKGPFLSKCHHCGLRCSNVAGVTHTCKHCGTSWDQGSNAVRNVYGVVSGSSSDDFTVTFSSRTNVSAGRSERLRNNRIR